MLKNFWNDNIRIINVVSLGLFVVFVIVVMIILVIVEFVIGGVVIKVYFLLNNILFIVK